MTNGRHHREQPRRRDWRNVHHSPWFWVGVAMFMAAILTYVFSEDLSLRPRRRAGLETRPERILSLDAETVGKASTTVAGVSPRPGDAVTAEHWPGMRSFRPLLPHACQLACSYEQAEG